MAEEQQHADMQLAFRSEGQYINAYLEHKGRDPFVYLIGSVRISMVADAVVRKTWEHTIALAVGSFAQQLSGNSAQFRNWRTMPAGGRA